MKIKANVNSDKNSFQMTGSDREKLLSWFQKYKEFEIIPVRVESRESRGYLEGAVIPAYCEWQYGIDPKENGLNDKRRYLFKKDFNYEILNDRSGNPNRIPKSTKGSAPSVLNTYTLWAEENGAPIPNPALFNLWKDKYAINEKFPTFFDFLLFLKISCDSFPTKEDFAKLDDFE